MDDMRALAHRMHHAFNTRDLAATGTIFAPGFVSHPMGTTGPESVRRAWSAMLDRHPELHTVIEDVVAEDDKVVVRFTLTGAPATERGRAPEAIEMFRVENERIAELWGVSTLR